MIVDMVAIEQTSINVAHAREWLSFDLTSANEASREDIDF
jgi:hypothetical protein